MAPFLLQKRRLALSRNDGGRNAWQCLAFDFVRAFAFPRQAIRPIAVKLSEGEERADIGLVRYVAEEIGRLCRCLEGDGAWPLAAPPCRRCLPGLKSSESAAPSREMAACRCFSRLRPGWHGAPTWRQFVHTVIRCVASFALSMKSLPEISPEAKSR